MTSTPTRPGISATTLAAAEIKFCDYPVKGSIKITYWTEGGERTNFSRYRLPDGQPDEKRYHQDPGTHVYVYYPPGFFHCNGNAPPFGIASHSVFIVEGEFKALSLLELGVPTLGTPSFTIYSKGEDGNRRLLRDLQSTLGKEKPSAIYFLGDADTCTNFAFSVNASFLASAAHPAKVLLPRIPFHQCKGVDDCKEAMGPEKFETFFTDLIRNAIPLPQKIDPPDIALLLLEPEMAALKALEGAKQIKQSERIVRMCAAAQRFAKSAATAHLCKLARQVIGLTAKEFDDAIKHEQARQKSAAASRSAPKSPPATSGTTATPGPAKKVELILPGHHVEIIECAANAFPVLSRVDRYFTRDRTIFELITKGKVRIDKVGKTAFCSQLEQYFTLLSLNSGPHGTLELVKRRCSEADADKLLKCDLAFELLPPIALITASPVFIERDGTLEILRKGYHNVRGGIYVTSAFQITEIEVTKAIAVIKSFSNDFRFVAESDRSRFLAGLIAPSLRQGGLIEDDFPVWINEADKVQTGKTYALKCLCALYQERPYTMTIDEQKGPGSHDEKLSKGLIEGRPFIMWENARGLISSQLAESAIRGTGYVTCRVAFMAPIEVPTDKFIWLLSSNKASVTTDLAARSLITRFRKQPESYQFKKFGGGRDLLKEIEFNSSYYLSCVLSIIREWFVKGKSQTNDRRHDFTNTCQALDWIVQNLFKCAPLLDDHQNEQKRVSNPLINWLRDVALAVEKSDKLDEFLRASEISDICADQSVSIPNFDGEETDEKARNQTIGKHFKQMFKDVAILSVSGFTVKRETSTEYNIHRQENMEVTRHSFTKD